ncbi:MAG TPA: class IV adenylate cyclase [Candidatus Angelobacter sp.]|jgi:adenylate cyclase class 2|nr:class IV adenylate cyclase [Candidatus Angelobacter sp.]
MASALEVEIKFKIEDLKTLTRELRGAGFRLVTRRTHEMNTLYDLPGQPLRRKGEVFRLRKYGDLWTVTYKAKGKAGRHKSRKEIETRMEDGRCLADILEAVGFVPSFRYEKFRSEWTDGKGHVVIDETPIGNFGEIEGPAKWIDSIARRLQISTEEYITDSYAVLFLKWKEQAGSPATDMLFRLETKRVL